MQGAEESQQLSDCSVAWDKFQRQISQQSEQRGERSNSELNQGERNAQLLLCISKCVSCARSLHVSFRLLEVRVFAALVRGFLCGSSQIRSSGSVNCNRSADKLHRPVSWGFCSTSQFPVQYECMSGVKNEASCTFLLSCFKVITFNDIGSFAIIWLHFIDTLPCLDYVTSVVGFET